MANITKRNGAYRITVSLGRDHKGNQIRKYMTFVPTETAPSKIEKEVQAAASDFERKVLSGQLFDGENMTFYDFAEEHWFPGYAEKNLSPSVLHDYRRQLENRIYPAIGSMKLSRITALQLNKIYDELLAEGLRPNSVKRYHATLQSIFKYAFKSGIIQENPCLRCTLPKTGEKYKYQIWTADQVNTFFQALRSSYPVRVHFVERVQRLPNGEAVTVPEYDYQYAMEKTASSMFIALYTLSFYSSARRGELAALTWEDVDFEGREIRINKAASSVKGEQFVKKPKTASGIRRITLPEICFSALREWRKEELELSMTSAWEGYTGKNFDKNFIFIQQDHVFHNYTGKMICVDTIGQKFKKIVQDYNSTCENDQEKLPEIRLHDLRHTGASLMIAGGMDIVTASHRLGHAKASTTIDIYSHSLPLKDKEASDLLERLVSG